MNLLKDKILVTGADGMLGKAISELLPKQKNICLPDRRCCIDLTLQNIVFDLFLNFFPEYVIHLAAKVGGIRANLQLPGTFYKDNICMNTNILECSKEFNVKKVISILSTCVYPDNAKYPLTEEQIHNGPPHDSNYAYAYSKRMLDIQSRAYRDQYGCNFITVVPTNLFGENDNFDLNDSHVIPAIIRKIYEARKNNIKEVELWGTGKPKRQFLYVKDAAKMILFLLENYNEREPINIGKNEEISIKDVAFMIKDMLQYKGDLQFNGKLDGQMRKPASFEKFEKFAGDKKNKFYTPFSKALRQTCEWFEENYPYVRGVNGVRR